MNEYEFSAKTDYFPDGFPVELKQLAVPISTFGFRPDNWTSGHLRHAQPFVYTFTDALYALEHLPLLTCDFSFSKFVTLAQIDQIWHYGGSDYGLDYLLYYQDFTFASKQAASVSTSHKGIECMDEVRLRFGVSPDAIRIDLRFVESEYFVHQFDWLYCCRVCGRRHWYMIWGTDGKTETYRFDNCPCCGCEFGTDDYSLERVRCCRQDWIERGSKWAQPHFKPSNWTFAEQENHIPVEFR